MDREIELGRLPKRRSNFDEGKVHISYRVAERYEMLVDAVPQCSKRKFMRVTASQSIKERSGGRSHETYRTVHRRCKTLQISYDPISRNRCPNREGSYVGMVRKRAL